MQGNHITLNKFLMKSISLTVLLSLSVMITAKSQDLQSLVKELHGSFTTAERRAATDSLTESGASLWVRQAGEYVLVTIESDTIGVASLCIGSENEVTVLHASAALGDLKFHPVDGLWHTSERFKWELRDTTMSTSTQEERQAHINRNGWVASTSLMGNPNYTEFLIRRSALPSGRWYLSAGIMPGQHPEVIIGIPSSDAGDCAAGNLVRGMVPSEGYTFEPISWKLIAER